MQGFSPTRPVRPLNPSFCSYFHVFMHYFMHFREFSDLFNLGIFVDSMLFFWNWSLGFVGILLYTWSLLINLINLGFCDKLKFLGFVLNSIWGFCSIRLKLMQLACWLDIIGHSKLFSNLCNDQLVNLFKKLTSGFIFFGVLVRNSMLKPILWVWT